MIAPVMLAGCILALFAATADATNSNSAQGNLYKQCFQTSGVNAALQAATDSQWETWAQSYQTTNSEEAQTCMTHGNDSDECKTKREATVTASDTYWTQLCEKGPKIFKAKCTADQLANLKARCETAGKTVGPEDDEEEDGEEDK